MHDPGLAVAHPLGRGAVLHQGCTLPRPWLPHPSLVPAFRTGQSARSQGLCCRRVVAEAENTRMFAFWAMESLLVARKSLTSTCPVPRGPWTGPAGPLNHHPGNPAN